MSDANATTEPRITFLSLPNETLEKIATELPIRRLIIFSTLSKRLRGVSVSVVYGGQSVIPHV